MNNISEILKGEFIHYGTKKLKCSLFKKASSSLYSGNKPTFGTGMWSSPINSSYGWKHWCDYENFRNCDEENSFKFKLKHKSKIYIIDNMEDLEKLPFYDMGYYYNLDFVKITQRYDAILLTQNGQILTRHGHPINLYGWDCECLLVLNKKCIKIV